MKKQISLLLVALGLSLSNGAQAGAGRFSSTARQVTPLISRYTVRPSGLSQGAINAARTYARQPMQQFSMPAARTFATKAPEIAARPNYSSWESMKKWLAGLLAGGALVVGTGSVKAEEESEAERDSRFKAEQSLYFKNLLGQGVPEYVREFQTNRLSDAIWWHHMRGDRIEQIKDAIAKGANPSQGLINAAYYGQEDVAKELLNAGADVNTRTNYGGTPLIEAARFSDNPNNVVNELIKSGADVNAKDKHGRTALSYAWGRSSDRYAPGLIRILEQAGAKE